jgi:hypothetical protein
LIAHCNGALYFLERDRDAVAAFAPPVPRLGAADSPDLVSSSKSTRDRLADGVTAISYSGSLCRARIIGYVLHAHEAR